MEKMVKLKIDGKEFQAPEGINILDAAELAGIHIPNLCYLKGMKGIGACRLCLVEVEGREAPVVACLTKVKEGMNIKTTTEHIEEIRKFVIDLILSMHPLDCMTCTKAGVCSLQKYAYDFELKESSFTRKKLGYPTDEANPFIKRDPDYCIFCGRCVRVCKEQGTNVLAFMGRGIGSKVTTANDSPLHESGCTFCGSCIDVCPVNAILEADRWRKGREWEYEKVNSVCLFCGNSCDITVSTKDDRIMKINAGAVEGSSERYICAYGRFGFDYIDADTRITLPLKRVNGELKETTWQDAIEIVAKELKSGRKNLGFISTASILNEDALTLKRFTSEVVKTKDVDTTASLYGDVATLISDSADIDGADLFVLVDLDPNQWKRVLPALDAIIRRKVNGGAKLITINSSEPSIASVATVNLNPPTPPLEKGGKEGFEASALMSLAKALINKGLSADKKLASAVSNAVVTEAIENAASLFLEAKNPVILTSPAMYHASANISLLKGTAVSVPIESNAKGVIMLGLTTEGKSYKEMLSGELGLLYVIGEIPITHRPNVDFLIVQNSHLTELAKQADIVLPSATSLEAEGSIVDYIGRLKYVNKAVEPVGEAKQHRDIFIELSAVMGSPIKEPKEDDIKKVIDRKAKPSLSPFKKKEGFAVSPNEMLESINASVINGSRLLWLKEIEKIVTV